MRFLPNPASSLLRTYPHMEIEEHASLVYNRIMVTRTKLLKYPFRSAPFLLAVLSFFAFSGVANAGLILNHPNYTGLNKGLVGYWSFDGPDMSVNTALDRSGQGNNGVLTNSPLRTLGKLGQGLSFDGGVSDNYVNVGSALGISSYPFTISSWVYATRRSQNYIAGIGDSTAADNTYGINTTNTGPARIRIETTATGAVSIDGTSNIFDSWHHVLATFESDTKRVLYVDGIQETVNTTSIPFQSGPNTTRMGAIPDATPAGFLGGKLDEVRIYNRALSPDEIKRLYRIGATLHVNTQINNDSLAKGLVGYWSFDGKDMTATHAMDASGQENKGVLTNGPAIVRGKIGQGLNFDGADQDVSIGSPTELDNLANLTYCAWVFPKSNGTSNAGRIFDKNQHGFRMSTSNRFGFYVEYDAAVTTLARYSTGNGNLVLNEWQHACVTWDGTNISTGITLYKNGAEVSGYSSATNGGTTRDNDGNSGLGIGDRSGATSVEFVGSIDEARVYNRILSPGEIKRLYRIGATLHVNTQINNDSLKKGLVGYWSFDGKDISGTVAYDRSGQGNNGTLTNGPAIARGKIGQGLDFDGSDDFVNTGSNLDNLAAMTVSLWIRPETSGEISQGSFIRKNTSGGSGRWDFGICCAPEDKIIFFKDGTTDLSHVTVANSITHNTWQHMLFTWDGSTTAANVHIYKNGVEISYSSAQNGVSLASDAAHDLVIGARGDNAEAFDGQIDEVRIYNRVLSADEIKRLYIIGGGR